ncbi:MAG: hypothetical protein FNP40_02940 [Dehalobacter sp. 4CP]|uniref:hypothetical protein n=1 Tax=Dehalobacter sp. CP TaxID=2594474 RepID=UPI0013CD3031|nr:hypothetical protein [Dehalobacter sp. 4CP]
MRLYKLFSLTAAVIFAVIGFIFLFFPDSALIFFNRFSFYFGLPQSPVQGSGFYLTLASAYMYLVTVLAILMYRYPQQKIYPFLLAHGKLASSVLSIYLFLMHQHYLIYLTNFVIDGCIGIAAVILMKMKKTGV